MIAHPGEHLAPDYGVVAFAAAFAMTLYFSCAATARVACRRRVATASVVLETVEGLTIPFLQPLVLPKWNTRGIWILRPLMRSAAGIRGPG
ncbi:MAG TPA: hypothetical protein VNB89_06400, partial [Gemmatimonadaceae bacterium]|nr:hypothetical protein [Gemmatimonadaceae bacterium]